MHIAICDDEEVYQNTVCEAIMEWAEAHQNTSAVIPRIYHSSEELWDAIQKGTFFDMLFLDVQIPGELSGIELAKLIRKSNEQAIIVFITNYSEYVYEGYVVDALRYLRKPITPVQIYECLDIAFRRIQLSRGKSLLLKSNRQSYIFPYQSIIMIEIVGHRLLVHTTSDSNPRCFREKISVVIEQLPQELFVQCHRSYIVNLMCVRRFSKNTLWLSTGMEIPISKSFFSEFEPKFELYYQGEQL